MSKKRYIKLIIMLVLIMLISFGCTKHISNKNNKIAYIAPNPESDYKKTFEDLQLGKIFDFDLKLFNAEESWIEMWVESYSNGKMIESRIELSMGAFLNKVEKGSMGIGIMDLHSEEMQIFLYALGGSTKPSPIDNDILVKGGISMWTYPINDKRVALEYGEEMLLAVYRQGEKQLRTYDTDLDSINKMISEDKTVLLFKVKFKKIEKRD